MKLRSKVYFALCVLCFTVAPSYAKDITILYTGETHAMLYPCNCPLEPDGGVARRAALSKELRQANPDTLFLDSGGFFGGGLMDEYTQNTQLDKERTLVNLKAMGLMKYDAVTLGDDELNFGREFLEENIKKNNLTVLSCNISGQNSTLFKPYIVKDIAGIKVGIIGVTTPYAAQKTENYKFIEPLVAVQNAVSQLKKQGVGVIILLSHLGENEDTKLLKVITGIDVIVVGHSRSNEQPFSKIGNTIILRPSWQGRSMGKLTLNVSGSKIMDYKTQELRLSDKIAGDPGILSILPHCFSDLNCKKEGSTGICQDPGAAKAQCVFSQAVKVPLLIITVKDCLACDSTKVVNFLRRQFPGLSVSYLYYPAPAAAKLVKEYAIEGLPAYLLGKEAEGEKAFQDLKENLEKKGNSYMLKPTFSGIAYFLDRKKTKDKLDIFISLYDKDTKELLTAIKDYNPAVHFLAYEQNGKFDAPKGNLEAEEDLRCVCVQKYYPRLFWDYLSCRAENINSSWWDECIPGVDSKKIKECARSNEGKALLRDNTGLNKELKVMLGPTYLMDNREIFSTQGVPTKEEFKKIFRR